VAWPSGNTFDPINYSMLGRVSTAMGDCLWAGKPSWYVTSRMGQLGLPSLRGRKIEYWPIWLGLRWGTFTCVRWQVTLWNPIWQVTLRSSVRSSLLKSYKPIFTFTFASLSKHTQMITLLHLMHLV